MKTRNSQFITLKHLLIDEKKQIGLKYQPDRVIDALIKEIPDILWSDQFCMLYLRNTPTNLDLLFGTFRGIAWIDCRHFFPNKPINIQ